MPVNINADSLHKSQNKPHLTIYNMKGPEVEPRDWAQGALNNFTVVVLLLQMLNAHCSFDILYEIFEK
jgi:hypothetical protein